jgi:hypothetical protein
VRLTETESQTPESGSELQLKLILTLCGGGSCPTVYRTNRGTLVVQGYAVDPEQAGIDVPDGERLIEIPADLFQEAARAAP